MNDRTLELINKEIDGYNNAAESQELNSILSSDPSVKRYFENQKQMASAIARVPSHEPPVSIKQQIMEKIQPQRIQRVSVTNRNSSENSWLHWTSTVRIAVGMAAGILITAILWPSSGTLPLNDYDVSGTIVGQVDKAKLSTETLSQSNVNASITWVTRESDVIVVLSVDGPEPATIQVASSGVGNVVRTVTREQAGNSQIDFESSSVIIHHTGKNVYTVVIERGGLPNAIIGFKLEVNGQDAKTTANVIW
jgi:anti-sigma-K factor RskA